MSGELPEFMTTFEVAEKLRVDVLTVRDWIKDEKLTAIRVGKEWRIPRAAFRAWCKERESKKTRGFYERRKRMSEKVRRENTKRIQAGYREWRKRIEAGEE